jgi:hypothetical protein
MYLCQVTGKVSEPGEKLNKIVVQTRSKTYRESRYNEEIRRYETVDVGQGVEIVREIDASDEGVSRWEAMSDSDRKYLVEQL